MSCFIVSDAHLNALIATAIYGPKDAQAHVQNGLWHVWYRPAHAHAALGLADKIGKMLLGENLKSYNCHYSSEADAAEDTKTIAAYRFPVSVEALARIDALKALACLEYQSDGGDDWHNSDAADFVRSLRSELIKSLPGYEDAPWHID